jgi:hypothetical protein
MHEWNLGPGDPLYLTLAADARLCSPDYTNDHIWELELGSGEPPSLSLYTTYGLRARSMRIFPRFTEDGTTLCDPMAFATPPRLKRFFSNYLCLIFSPFSGIEVVAEYWVPESQAVTGRMMILNHTTIQRKLGFEICGFLVPIEGQILSNMKMQMVHVLAGQSKGLAPVIILLGGSQPGLGPYPSLQLELELGPGATRRLSWAQAALNDAPASFELVRRLAAHPWEAERTRIELLNSSQLVDIHTGDPEWDAALAFSQRAAFSLFFGARDQLPEPSFVQVRQPDCGHSDQGDGSDYPPMWSGQPPLETYYLAGLLPGAPHLARGLLLNFLDVQADDGFIGCQPGLAGQRGGYLAAPLLASLAWDLYRVNGDDEFLAEVFPKLLAFWWVWFTPSRDHDRDGWPEWQSHRQTGFEDNPLFSFWQSWSQGVEINLVECPALAAALSREAGCFRRMAELLHRPGDSNLLLARQDILLAGLQSCWSDKSGLYQYIDRDTHACLRGKLLGHLAGGAGLIRVKQDFTQPVRLLIKVQTKGKSVPHPEVVISEYLTKVGEGEVISKQSFHWRENGAVATSQKVYSRIGKIDLRGIGARDKVTIRTVDLTGEDHTLFLPLWAGVPDTHQVQMLIRRLFEDVGGFTQLFGIPACPSVLDSRGESVCLSVHLPWNHLIGEGLLAYGYRNEAAQLVTRLMKAVIQNLKQNRAFYRYYHAESGSGLGERNALGGLAPLGLFLQTLGVTIIPPSRVRLEGQHPFPWPVTIYYRELTITRHTDHTDVILPNRQTVTVTDPAPCIVSQ